MSGDFKPLRRKIGLVTLFAACLLATAWIRGKATNLENGVSIPFGGQVYHLFLGPNEIDLVPLVVGQVMTPDQFASRALIKIPHRPVVIPLTLLSAWLLLSTTQVPAERLPE